MRVEYVFNGNNNKRISSSYEIIFRCENVHFNDDGKLKKKNEISGGNVKRKIQMEKQIKDQTISDDESEKILISLVRLLKIEKEKCRRLDYNELSDVIARSPMRNHHDYTHGTTKSNDYPYTISRVCNGVTRVVEPDRTNTTSSLYKRIYSSFQSPNVAVSAAGHHVSDVDLCDINLWLNLCKKDPKLLNDFVQDCQSELSKKEMTNLTTLSNFYEHRFSRNTCSSVSSQFTSPAQSPSERSLTSPESVTFEENSLYFTRSPNIPSLDSVSLKLDGDDKYINNNNNNNNNDGNSSITNINGDNNTNNAHCSNIVHDFNILPDDGYKSSEMTKSPDSVPNIGTVMLNLAEDPYESTIDLNQFANVCDTHTEPPPPPMPSMPPPPPPPPHPPPPTSSPSSSSSSSPQRSSATIIYTERDALNAKLDPKAKENAWARINQLDIDLLGKGDEEGDTQLMILLVSDKLTLEYVYVIVERLLKENPEYLSCRNELNQDALYLASCKLVREPLIASYIGEALIRGGQDVNKKYDGGNTILHHLAQRGDSHVKILENLLKLNNCNNNNHNKMAFDVNKKNNRGFTPLHIACEQHKDNVLHAYQTVKVLMKNGADCSLKDYKDENTPLHILVNESCDLDLMRIILENRCTSNKSDSLPPTAVANRQGNTVLHLSCGRNTLTLQHQKDVIRLLLWHGAMIQLKNINGCVPSVLVDSTRKQEIKTILHSHRLRQS